MSVIVYGNFYPLPPFKGLPVYSSATLIKGLLTLDLWHKFKMAGLTVIMKQREDYQFINILNKTREGQIDKDVELTLSQDSLTNCHIRKMLFTFWLKINQLNKIMKYNWTKLRVS